MMSATWANCSGVAGETRATILVDAVERRFAYDQRALDVGPGFAEAGSGGLPRQARWRRYTGTGEISYGAGAKDVK